MDVMAEPCGDRAMMSDGPSCHRGDPVQKIVRGDGRRAYTIVLPDGDVCGMADRFLRRCKGGMDRTYAYLLVDHLRWLERSVPAALAVSRDYA